MAMKCSMIPMNDSASTMNHNAVPISYSTSSH